jgi:hypothetical protein
VLHAQAPGSWLAFGMALLILPFGVEAGGRPCSVDGVPVPARRQDLAQVQERPKRQAHAQTRETAWVRLPLACCRVYRSDDAAASCSADLPVSSPSSLTWGGCIR